MTNGFLIASMNLGKKRRSQHFAWNSPFFLKSILQWVKTDPNPWCFVVLKYLLFTPEAICSIKQSQIHTKKTGPWVTFRMLFWIDFTVFVVFFLFAHQIPGAHGDEFLGCWIRDGHRHRATWRGKQQKLSWSKQALTRRLGITYLVRKNQFERLYFMARNGWVRKFVCRFLKGKKQCQESTPHPPFPELRIICVPCMLFEGVRLAQQSLVILVGGVQWFFENFYWLRFF